MDIDKTQHINVRFRQLFEDHYEKLHRYAYTILKDEEAAHDAVQSVFMRFKMRDREYQGRGCDIHLPLEGKDAVPGTFAERPEA